MNTQQIQHSDYQQLATRIAELNATLKAMETQLHTSTAHNTQSHQNTAIEIPLAIAAG